jgi:hypothetical protein
VRERDEAAERHKRLAAVRERLRRGVSSAVSTFLSARGHEPVSADLLTELEHRRASASELADAMRLSSERRDEMIAAATSAVRARIDDARRLVALAQSGDLEATSLIAASTTDERLRELLCQGVIDAFVVDAEVWVTL